MTSDGIHTYTYDAESNVLSVDGGATAQYVYDALNHRVWVKTAIATDEYLYDYAGRRISEWAQPSNAGDEGRIYWDGMPLAYRAQDGRTYFEHEDWTGTTRVRTDYQGNQAALFASLPFGDGSSSTVYDSAGAQERTHFAMLDLDKETDTDHATFRQYSNTQGSWMSPDPYSGSYDINNPQSMNRYTYVLNNPLSFIDPSGLDEQTDNGGSDIGSDCWALYCPGAVGVGSSPGSAWDNAYGFAPGYTLDGQGIPSSWAGWLAQSGAAQYWVANSSNYRSTAMLYFTSFLFAEVLSDGTWMDFTPADLYAQGLSQVGGGGAPNHCVSPGVCKSTIDNFNLMEKGKTSYRDSLPICSTHTTVDNSTGAANSHVDLFNPGASLPTMNGSILLLPFHLLFDAFPDYVYGKTGYYPWPAGRTLCQ